MSLSSRLIQIFRFRFREWLVIIILIGLMIYALSVGVRHIQEGAKECQCRGNIYPLSLALKAHESTYGCFPPPFVSDQFDKPLYSWRVLILQWDAEIFEEFDYTKPWNDPVNMQIATKGHNELLLRGRFSCPSVKHEKSSQTDYFYALNGEDRWPHDFFIEANPRPKIVLVESQWRDVYWSEPVDFVYDKSAEEGFLGKLRETKPPHPSGYNCVTSDLLSFKIPYSARHRDDDRLIQSTLFSPRAKEKDGAEKERIDQLVAKLMKALGDPTKTYARTPLLWLSELGPQAAAAVPMIRRIRDEGDPRLRPIAAMALARIEK